MLKVKVNINNSGNMSKKNITLIFNHFEREHLGKDVFLLPYYFGKKMDSDVTIVYPQTATNKDFPSKYRGVKLVPLKLYGKVHSLTLLREWRFVIYLLKHAKDIDVLIRFHQTVQTGINGFVYKLFNKKGLFYVKLDINPDLIDAQNPIKNILKKKIVDYLINKSMTYVDIVSCETTSAFERIQKSQLSRNQWKDKLILLKNGFDEDLIEDFGISVNSYSNKDNIFLTVGRLGTVEKNTELILDAISELELGDWKFYLVGPIEKEFKDKIEMFFLLHPEKRDTVIFTGPIYEKRELWEIFNKAKVFVLSSRWESSGLVFNEAKRFRNFIVSTQVGSYFDISCNGKYGCHFQQESSRELQKKLKDIIANNINIDVYEDADLLELSWNNIVDELVDFTKKHYEK